TGARFVLDARRKHRPTLLEEGAEDRAKRADFLLRSIDLARDLGAELVSIWSGASPTGVTSEGGEARERERMWKRLTAELLPLLRHAREREIALAFEPEPGMFVERPAGYFELVERLGDAGEDLGLCLDVGHLLVTGDLPVGDVIRRAAPRLVHVHLD